MSTKDKIIKVIKEIEELLLSKNEQYGDSALKPIGLFAKGNPEEILVKICQLESIKKIY